MKVYAFIHPDLQILCCALLPEAVPEGVEAIELEVERLKQKYATQLQQREAIRQWNEQMKQAIRNAQTLEELRSIEIRYG